MTKVITTEFDPRISAIVVQFPALISLDQMQSWVPRFKETISQNAPECKNLLLDTNEHNFENIACLRLLKTTLTQDPEVTRHLKRVAFVQPRAVREPSIVSPVESYFTSFEDAYSYLFMIGQQIP